VQAKRKQLTPEEAKAKIFRYCAYQERCHQEVRNKLYELGVRNPALDELITYLITEGFLNEERYAKAFAGGKFRMKNWGRIKIVQHLESKGLSKNCIRAGLKEIEEPDYQQSLLKLLTKRLQQASGESIFIRRNDAAKYAIQKGFEPDLVWEKVKIALPD
jgi:regulatory protein